MDVVEHLRRVVFEMIERLRYAFGNTMARRERKIPRLVALRDGTAERAPISRYLRSDRRIPFNEQGIFRHYPELDRARLSRT